ncbi:hypothetical protein HOL21_02815 [Candidatus Woesearchaeota archaeon]|jgi:hypothetical protein|nr:hypothetical protein [Candidatus Woesearchaeota archaeon]MBT5397120.1 hypothetical protein [Candidatus Woesearchaeota archaeon]MBT6367334.1 hypothetical protein [Candidatus Woesearchaeota archaeon]MBT7762520.1 hypothetical protein [Candidatus Woesearchaeota archaeon]
MDVERIQKVNDLAVDLLKQGLARDREDAVAQAETIFKTNESEEYTNFREAASEIKQEKTAESVLDDETIKTILSKNTTFLVNTINEFKDKIESLEREITILKSNSVRQPRVQDLKMNPPIQEPASPSQESVQPVEQQAQQSSEPVKDHPRSGNYNDADVSIEKFFYMGNK